MHATITVLPGDGIGPEVVAEAVAVLRAVAARWGYRFDLMEALPGGCAIDATGATPPRFAALRPWPPGSRECKTLRYTPGDDLIDSLTPTCYNPATLARSTRCMSQVMSQFSRMMDYDGCCPSGNGVGRCAATDG